MTAPAERTRAQSLREKLVTLHAHLRATRFGGLHDRIVAASGVTEAIAVLDAHEAARPTPLEVARAVVHEGDPAWVVERVERGILRDRGLR